MLRRDCSGVIDCALQGYEAFTEAWALHQPGAPALIIPIYRDVTLELTPERPEPTPAPKPPDVTADYIITDAEE